MKGFGHVEFEDTMSTDKAVALSGTELSSSLCRFRCSSVSGRYVAAWLPLRTRVCRCAEVAFARQESPWLVLKSQVCSPRVAVARCG
eukprot:63871-Rhodomonas_salina.1